MTLTLDHNQRLNLVAMLDILECQGRREVWAVCALQTQLDLNDQERETIGWRKLRSPDGNEYVVWNRTSSLEYHSYELEDDDVKRVCRAVDNYRVVLARDRNWWEPLIIQLPLPEQSNGIAH